MLKYCGWHEKYFGKSLFMGQVAPLLDKSTTHGLCDDCSMKLHKEVDEYKKRRAERETQSQRVK